MLLQKHLSEIPDPMRLTIFDSFMASLTTLLHNYSLLKKARNRAKRAAKEKSFAGKNERKLWSIYQKYTKGDCVPLNSVRDAFNDLKLYPSLTQVHEMVCYAKECPAHNSGDGLAFGEFCVFAIELEEFYKKGIESPKPVSVIRTARMAIDTKCKTDVFLGGSCDPTTWRAECAIPYLEKQHISYYNPQVNMWSIERINSEDEAKQTSQVLLFVIDNRTRAISSLIEVAYLVGCQRQVVLVFNESSGKQVIVKGKKTSESEHTELKRSYDIITHLSERNGYPIFNDLSTSLKCLNRMVKQQIKVQQLSSSDGARPVKYGHLRLGHTLQHLWDVFHSYCENSDRLSYKQACEAFHYATGQLLDIAQVESVANGSDTIGFTTFCCLVMEAKSQLALCYPSLRQLLTNTLLILLSITKTVPDWLGWMFGRTPALRSERVEDCSDFYLGGNHSTHNWKESIAVPLLRQHNCTYVSPQLEEWNWKTISKNHAQVERCQLLLYVIPADIRALTDMIQAAYYIGQGCRIVLCVQMMPENNLQDEELAGAAQDYNRGRAYLCDIAKRENVPVFSDVEEAVRHAIFLLKPPPPTLVMTQKVTI